MIELNTKQKVIIVVVYTAVCIAGGRYLAPVKVKTETKIITVEAQTDNKQTNEDKTTHEKTTITETDKPDGSKTITTVKEDVSNDSVKVDDAKTDTKQTSIDKTKEVTKESSELRLSLLAGINVTNPAGGIIYGGEVSKDILGPISIGIFGMSNGTAGCSVGIRF